MTDSTLREFLLKQVNKTLGAETSGEDYADCDEMEENGTWQLISGGCNAHTDYLQEYGFYPNYNENRFVYRVWSKCYLKKISRQYMTLAHL